MRVIGIVEIGNLSRHHIHNTDRVIIAVGDIETAFAAIGDSQRMLESGLRKLAVLVAEFKQTGTDQRAHLFVMGEFDRANG